MNQSNDRMQELDLPEKVFAALAGNSPDGRDADDTALDVVSVLEKEREKAFAAAMEAACLKQALDKTETQLRSVKQALSRAQVAGESTTASCQVAGSFEEFEHMRELRDAYRRLATAVLEEIRWLDEGVQHLYENYSEAIYRSELDSIRRFEPRYLQQIKAFRGQMETMQQNAALTAPPAVAASQARKGIKARVAALIRRVLP